MSYILKKIGKSTNVPYYTFECDDESDLSAIDVTGASIGSRCYVINSGKWFALNSIGEWKNIKNKPAIATDDDVMDFLAGMEMITPVTNSDGEILISSSNEIYSL